MKGRQAVTITLSLPRCLEFMRHNKGFVSQAGSSKTNMMEKSELSVLLTWLNNKQCTHKNTVAIRSELKNSYDITTTTTLSSSSKSKHAGNTSHSAQPSIDLQSSKINQSYPQHHLP